MRGPRIQPCFYHPHKMSTIRDVAKTWRHYCSRECFLRGWHTLPQHSWNPKPEENEAEDPIAQWTEVGNSRQYSPTQNDIERPLRLDIIPLTKSGKEAKGKMTITTGTVIPTPKEARMRQMISNGGTFNAEWLQKQFKVFNWNILADLYATENVYPYCEKWALSWNWRKHLIIKEVKSMGADIITLQEVQKDAFDEWFKPELAADGYDGLFQQKKRDPIFHRGKYTSEGCATFWRTSRFKRVEKHIFDYDRLSQQNYQLLLTAWQSSIFRACMGIHHGMGVTHDLPNFPMAPSHSCRLRRHACVYHQHKHKPVVISKYSQKADCFDQADLRRHAAHVASWVSYGEPGRIPTMDEFKLLKKYFDKMDGGRLPRRLKDVLSDMQSVLKSLPKPANEAWNKAERQLQKSLRKLHQRGNEPVADAKVVASHDDMALAELNSEQDDFVQEAGVDDSASPGTSAIADQHLRLFRKRNEWSFLDDSQKLERLKQAEQAARRPRSSLGQAELTDIINTAAACLAAPHRQAKIQDKDVVDSEDVRESEGPKTDLQNRARSLLLLALRVWRMNQFDCHAIQHVLDFLQEKINKFEHNVGQIQEAAAGKAWMRIKHAVDALIPVAAAPSSSQLKSADAHAQPARDRKPYKAGVRLERQSGIQNISWSVVGAAWECREYSRKGAGWKAKTRTFKISKFLEQGLANEAAVEAALQEAKAYREELVRQGKLKPPKPRPPRSTVRGVTFDISKKKWLVRLYHPVKKKHVHIGVFRAREEAEAKAREMASEFGIRSEYEVLRVKNCSGRGKSRFDILILHSEVAHHVRDQKQEEKVNQRLSKGNIALAVIVEARHMKNRHGAGHQLCVVNTHILCDPAAADVKLWQSHLLIKSIQATTRGNMPTLVCGDFNSTPDSAVYDYFRRGQVRENHEDLKKDPCGLIRQLTLQHNVALATAYETCTMKEASGKSCINPKP
ncbi:CCR4-1 [Symbiodinium microadriaticum]|nr:CCR4-1 [Symbiodinium microadriaticum]